MDALSIFPVAVVRPLCETRLRNSASTTMKVVEATPFFTPGEIEHLQVHVARLDSHWDRRRQQACGLIQSVSGRTGFPQRTASTAQLLYHRFHLFWNPADFVTHEVALACLVVAAKVNDTPKKSREIILTSYALRYPDLARTPAAAAAAVAAAAVAAASAATSTSGASVSKTGAGKAQTPPFAALSVVSESDVDANALEKERRRIVALEALILQCISFDLHLRPRATLSLTLKIAKRWSLDKDFASLAWKVASDSHRTYAPLCYPPSTIALASLYTAALISPNQGASSSVIACFQPVGVEREWEETLRANIEDVEEVVHMLLDLYMTAASSSALLAGGGSSSTGITPISPATPASPSDAAGLAAAALLDGPNDGSSRATPSSMKKLVSSQAYAPPPFGLVACLASFSSSSSTAAAAVGSASASDIKSELTQTKIRLRALEDERRKEDETALNAAAPNADDRTQQRARRRRIELPALLRHCRDLDTGGLKAQVPSTSLSTPSNAAAEALTLEQGTDDSDAAAIAAQQLNKEKASAHLTRFLF